MKHLNGDKELDDPQETEKPDGGPLSPSANSHHDPDIHGFEILECKYKVAVTEVIDLKAELKALKEKYNQAVEGQGDSHNDDSHSVQALSEQVCHYYIDVFHCLLSSVWQQYFFPIGQY